MTEDDISSAAEVWLRESRAAAIDLPWNEIKWALGQLPDPEACAVSDDATELLVLGRADVLFTVSTRGGKVMLSSRPLCAERMSISLVWDEPVTDMVQTRVTHWTFHWSDEPDAIQPRQALSGSVSTDRATGEERPDERERLARMLAGRAGWPSESEAMIRQRQMGEPPVAAANPEPRRRRLTDVWGRPLDAGQR